MKNAVKSLSGALALVGAFSVQAQSATETPSRGGTAPPPSQSSATTPQTGQNPAPVSTGVTTTPGNESLSASKLQQEKRSNGAAPVPSSAAPASSPPSAGAGSSTKAAPAMTPSASEVSGKPSAQDLKPAAVDRQSRLPDMRMWQLSVGQLELDKGFLTAMVDAGKRIKIPVPAYLIQHPRGLVLFDTGMNVEVSDGNCANYWGQGLCGAFTAIQGRDEVIDRQLRNLGFTPEDVTHVVYSHFHLDHAGNIKMFPKARHVVQKAELKTAWWPEKFQRAAYVLKDYDGTRDYDFVQLEGDFDLFGDGSLLLLDTQGHTQGHQSLQVNLKNTGTVLLAADAVYTAENEAGVIPGITWNTNASMRAIDRLKQIRDATQGALWYSHDPAQHAERTKIKVYD